MRIPFYPLEGCCSVCGKVMDAVEGGDLMCGECRCGNRPHFDRVANAVLFEENARRMVIDFKFNGHFWLRDDFVDWLEAAASARFSLPSVDLILPMPITLRHRLDRGFNQCEYLAAELARRIGRVCDSSALRRVGSPRRQAGLRREERLANVVGTFAVPRPERISGRTILVIDDVMTTGATLSECAKTLKVAGAWRIFALSLARPLADF